MGCKMGTLARNGGKWTTITNIDILKVINKLEAVTGGVLQKKMLLKILQYSLENTCFGVSL